jgi:HlyD family secretion protein
VTTGPAVASKEQPASRPAAEASRGLAGVAPALIGVVIVAGAAAAIYWSTARGAAVRYVTAKVSHGPVVRAVTTSGTVNPVITVPVGTYVSGVIQARYCDYNTPVKKGQICAKIDPRPYQVIVDQDRANVGVAKAQLVKDQANLVYAKLAYERNKKLATTKAVSQDALDASKNALDQAAAQTGLDEANIALQQANLHAAEINLGYTDIISPVDGTVVTRSVEMGQTVAASFQTPTLFLVGTDLTTMQVDTNVSESDVGAIKVGDKASFTVESFPNHPFNGQVTEVRQSPQTIQNIVTYDVVVNAPNKDLTLKPGMTATTRIVVDERADVLRAPDQALRYSPGAVAGLPAAQTVPDGSGGMRVWVLRNGSPSSTVIVPGLDDDTFTEILKGDLHAGDEIIIGEEVKKAASP